ncbi:MAG: chromosome segregation protein SMC [Candidatus Bathyarchaeia archaeon]
MVYIKRIELRGFKTFSRKVNLKLNRGLTVLTGPNGSGKSNILDALRFALGELSPKELRGSSLSDLVSKSTTPNQPKSAYVAIQFDNTDRRLPVDSSTVTVSREFHRGGEGIYRINGRRVSRKQLTELLSSADINVAGYNIIPQHAVTRLAEVTSEERRKIIEDLIGLGIYDVKKAEAQIQLNIADTNIKIASARIDEVRLRVESLERERNDFLRHSLLTKEISKLQAHIVSGKLSVIDKDIGALKGRIEDKESQLSNLKMERDRLQTVKSQLEHELKILQERLIGKGGQKIPEFERSLGDINFKIASLKAEINSKRLSLQLLDKQIEGLKHERDEYHTDLEAIREELKKFRESKVSLDPLIREKEVELADISDRLEKSRDGLTERLKVLEEVEGKIELARKEYVEVASQAEAESMKINLTQEEMKSLQTRLLDQKKLLDELKKRKNELEDLKAIQEDRLKEVRSEINRYSALKSTRSIEIEKAIKIVNDVKNLILEFEVKRGLLDLLAPEERILLEVEELQSSGVLNNVLGRLRDLLHFDQRYERAINTAGGEWMDSLVVKDMATAITCIEYLKRNKLGSLKIIPIETATPSPTMHDTPHIKGIINRAVDLLKYDPQIEGVVRSVFGDTLIAESQKAAYLTSIQGCRAVSVTGDLYDPRGFLQSGYRDPTLVRSIVPRTKTLNEIKEMTDSLMRLIERSKHTLAGLDSDLDRLKNEEIELLRSLSSIHRDIENLTERISSATYSLVETEKRLASMEDALQKNMSRLMEIVGKRSELEDKLIGLENECKSLRSPAGFEDMMMVEREHGKVLDELNQLRREATLTESKISSLESNIESKIRLSEHTEEQLSYASERSIELKSSLESTQNELEDWTLKLSHVTMERENLLATLESLRREISNLQARLEELNISIQKVEREMEAANSDLTTLRLELNRKELEQQYLIGELGRLGFDRPTITTLTDFKTLEENLSTLRQELQEIGAVNELAILHYEEQKNNYKQLSVRINQLEQEKASILRFMDELEQKKRETFIEVFERLNRNFNIFFSKITDGGKGKLVLENPEDIFSGGVDINLAFPGKAEMSVGSASGGEKSVATVCFLLALQAIHPMPFYVFDEIDAHLDMVNSQRLADLLKERSSNSQFIVISLKDTTISRADDVYGIYIQEGSSRLVAMPKPEAKSNV